MKRILSLHSRKELRFANFPFAELLHSCFFTKMPFAESACRLALQICPSNLSFMHRSESALKRIDYCKNQDSKKMIFRKLENRFFISWVCHC